MSNGYASFENIRKIRSKLLILSSKTSQTGTTQEMRKKSTAN